MRRERPIRTHAGFSIIELLVVITIIGTLVSMGIVSYNNTRERARDVRRLSDMNELAKGLIVYYNDNQKFPIVLAPTEITGSDTVSQALIAVDAFFGDAPADPFYPNATYQYIYNSSPDGRNYALSFCLETGKFPPYVAGCGNTPRGE